MAWNVVGSTVSENVKANTPVLALKSNEVRVGCTVFAVNVEQAMADPDKIAFTLFPAISVMSGELIDRYVLLSVVATADNDFRAFKSAADNDTTMTRPFELDVVLELVSASLVWLDEAGAASCMIIF